MSGDETWAKCGQCGTDLNESDKVCPKCGFTRKVFERQATAKVGIKPMVGRMVNIARTASVKVGVRLSTMVRQKRKGLGKFLREMVSRWRPSKDPGLKNGVMEERVIDKEKNEYNHIVRDAQTGKVIHEEHEPLSRHKSHPKR
jgi:ribosomal protein L37E